MPERTPLCKLFVDTLEKESSGGKKIRRSDIHVSDEDRGCIVDVKNPVTDEGSSIWINPKGNPSGELMVPHCKNLSGMQLMYLLTVGMELCGPDRAKGSEGCKITQVHIHPWSTRPDNRVVGSSHIHIECDIEKHSAHKYCLEKFAKALVKLNEYISKTCGD